MERSFVEIIAAKRDKLPLSPEEIQRFVRSYVAGQVADYQMSALLMASFLNGLSDEECMALTHAMLHSGTVVVLDDVPGFKVDKHSTGGVGDKVSLCLAPIVAAAGVPVPMISGRGLGHTGGTLDKLEAIPGFRTDLSIARFREIVREVGACLIGQTADLAPADKRIYGLRDVTATVECIPLIVASILSKKLAEGIDGLVLDVKVGRGAFMATEEKARALATALVRVGTLGGKKVVAHLTQMDDPLGVAVGNANETREAIDVLHGKGPADLVACNELLAVEMIRMGGRAATDDEARALVREVISSGKAARTFERLIEAQGGDPRVVEDPSLLAVAGEEVVVRADRAGIVQRVDTKALGIASVLLGAGRQRAEDVVDHAVGLSIVAKSGSEVRPGDALVKIHVRQASDAAKIAERVRAAYEIGEGKPVVAPLHLGRITA
jgi:pyrimidine-nucleoside phosphorylase